MTAGAGCLEAEQAAGRNVTRVVRAAGGLPDPPVTSGTATSVQLSPREWLRHEGAPYR